MNQANLGGTILDIAKANVKHFTAAFIILLSLTLRPSTGGSSNKCTDTFVSNRDTPKLDDKAFAKTYYYFRHKYGKAAPATLTVEINGVQKRIPTPPNIAKRIDPTKILNIAFMGVLGKVFNLEHNLNTGKTQKNLDLEYSKEVRTQTEAVLNRSHRASADFLNQVNTVVRFEQMGENTIFVRFGFGGIYTGGRDVISNAIANRFSVLYLHMANWAYRASGLEKNSVLSSANMMDEVVSLAKEFKVFEFQLIFDSKVWNAQMAVLETYVNDYLATADIGIKKEILDKISQPIDPFLPVAGVAVTKNFMNSNSPVEIKRYFKNELEDPLNIVNPAQKSDFLIRHLMLYKTIENLPPLTDLEVHSHTLIHTRAYAKLGFVDSGPIQSPQYSNVEVHLLTAKREDVLQKITAILNGKE